MLVVAVGLRGWWWCRKADEGSAWIKTVINIHHGQPVASKGSLLELGILISFMLLWSPGEGTKVQRRGEKGGNQAHSPMATKGGEEVQVGQEVHQTATRRRGRLHVKPSRESSPTIWAQGIFILTTRTPNQWKEGRKTKTTTKLPFHIVLRDTFAQIAGLCSSQGSPCPSPRPFATSGRSR